MATPSPSETSHHPAWLGESLITASADFTQSCMWIPWTIMLLAWWIAMHALPAMWMLAPRPSIVLCELMMSSCLSRITMSDLKIIQSGSGWMAAWRRVPGLGLTGSSWLGSVTV
ncbi:probable pectate lyase 22 [Phtheirospermum japonicum]|uniref:Probable pectate lyase 22 n=1 Tax=Phtheirospermum japonicum TaxID=374723 RepID=A0A830BBF1_9LAMI|nr:probable pectate lyase 22 [Phtheirospermum japonicum]